MNINDLPVYQMQVNEDETTSDGVSFVALVDKPAVKKNFLAFNEHKNIMRFTANEEKKIISGVLMLADTPIYRNVNGKEFYVVFSADTIQAIVQKFFSNGLQSKVNLMHDEGLQVDGITMFESFISSAERGISPMKGFEDAPDGSWFGSFKVNNPEVWQLVKDGKLKGFSIEGMFGLMPTPQQMMQHDSNIADEDKHTITLAQQIIELFSSL